MTTQITDIPTSDELATALGRTWIDTSYVVTIQHDGTWTIHDDSGNHIYQGTQKEVWNWLNRHPPSPILVESGQPLGTETLRAAPLQREYN